MLFTLGFVEYLNPPEWLGRLVKHAGTYQHMEQCMKGLISSRVPVYYLSATMLLLFITQRVVESRRWRA
jgi:hypothetical protein